MPAHRSYTGGRGPHYPSPVERLRLEGMGALVPQAAAEAEADRWLALIRSAAAPQTPSWFRFMGGDVTDQTLTPASGRVHVGSDFFAGTTVTADDEYAGGMLPFRNGVVVEQPEGTFSRQLYKTGSSGPWLEPVQADHPGRHYWPICTMMDPVDPDRLLVGCWLVNTPTATAPYGRLEDTHLVGCSLGFGGAVAQTVKYGHNGGGPHILKFWSDGTHVYSLWEDFYPDYDPAVPGPTYGADGTDLPYHHSRIKLARTTTAAVGGTSPTMWSWWNGAGWVANRAAAAYLSDVDGAPLRGDLDVTQVADGTMRAVGHALVDSHVDVWAADGITSPWRRICRVRAPGMGARINGGVQIGQFARFVEHVPAPAEHSVVTLSLNLLHAAGSAAGRNIRRYAPQFLVVPHYPG